MFPEIIIRKKTLTGDLRACLNIFFCLVSDFSNDNNFRVIKIFLFLFNHVGCRSLRKWNGTLSGFEIAYFFLERPPLNMYDEKSLVQILYNSVILSTGKIYITFFKESMLVSKYEYDWNITNNFHVVWFIHSYTHGHQFFVDLLNWWILSITSLSLFILLRCTFDFSRKDSKRNCAFTGN